MDKMYEKLEIIIRLNGEDIINCKGTVGEETNRKRVIQNREDLNIGRTYFVALFRGNDFLPNEYPLDTELSTLCKDMNRFIVDEINYRRKHKLSYGSLDGVRK